MTARTLHADCPKCRGTGTRPGEPIYLGAGAFEVPAVPCDHSTLSGEALKAISRQMHERAAREDWEATRVPLPSNTPMVLGLDALLPTHAPRDPTLFLSDDEEELLALRNRLERMKRAMLEAADMLDAQGSDIAAAKLREDVAG